MAKDSNIRLCRPHEDHRHHWWIFKSDGSISKKIENPGYFVPELICPSCADKMGWDVEDYDLYFDIMESR